MSDTLGQTGRDGGNGGLSSHSRREGGLSGRDIGHAGDHTVGIGLGKVGGEAIGVRDGGLNGSAAAGDIDDLGIEGQ